MAEKTAWKLDFQKLSKMSQEDWMLLILAHEKQVKSRGYVALMNEVFFFVKEFAPAVEEVFQFRGTGSGPYSPRVVKAVDKLVSEGFLDMRRDNNLKINNYSLTEKGSAKAKSLFKNLPDKERKKIRFAQFLGQRMGEMGTFQYLSSVHPGYVYVHTAGDAPV